MFAGEKDVTCPYATALHIRDQIGDTVKQFHTIEGKDHMYFASANDDEFIQNLMDQLVEPSDLPSHGPASLTGEVLRL